MTARRAKIVATIGPVSRDPGTLEALLRAGVDVVRLNFAHDTLAAHEESVAAVRQVAGTVARTVGVLIDLPGPKMRTGPIKGDWVVLEEGNEFVLTSEPVEGDSVRASTSVDGLADMVEGGDEIFLADGTIVLEVISKSGRDVVTRVLRRGVLRSRKGMHVPGAERSVEAFTPQDREALGHAVKLGADYVALSFVRDAEDIERARAALPAEGKRPHLIAKIETASALKEIGGIVAAADGIMVARGDLGIQTPLREVPLMQKVIIRACNEGGKPVITATQMLESMTHSPLPTRAEVADLANAVLDGTDALMLSEETAVGDQPVEAVGTMAVTVESAEGWPRQAVWPEPATRAESSVSWAVAHAAVQAAGALELAAILCPTLTGATPRRVAAFRPAMQVVGLSENAATLGSLTLTWGVTPLLIPPLEHPEDTTEIVAAAVGAARSAGLVEESDLVAVVAGGPGRRAGSTDFLRIVHC
ncbi:pyruvate kinase [soil metagenome]